MGTHPRHPDDLARLDDRALVALAQALDVDDPTAVETGRRCLAVVLLRHRDLVRSVIAAKVPRAAIDEVESDVVLGFATKVWSGAQIANPAGLLVRLATFRRADYLAGRRNGELGVEDWDSPATDPALDDLATEAAVTELLSCLTERQRDVVWQRIIEDRTSAEVAAAQGTTPGNVDVIVHRALARMREALQ